MDASHSQRANDNAKYLALYENLDQYIPGAPTQYQNRFGSKLSLNIIKSCIDSVSAEIAKTKPKPEYVTSGGDYRIQRRSELLTQYMEGVFYDNKVYTDHGPDVFSDAAKTGTGVLAVINDGERIKYERVLIDELYIDEYDGLYRKPKMMIHARRVFRDKLREIFQNDPKALQAIDDAPDASPISSDLSGPQDMVMVAEAWYLPHKVRKPKDKDTKKTSQGVKGGRYAVCLENYDLKLDDYKKDYHPFVFFRWNNKTVGFHGQGLAEDLVSIQLEIARTLQAISRGMRFTGLRVFLENGSRINPNHLNEDGTKGIPITTYSGTPPVVATWPANSNEIYEYLSMLQQRAMELSGVSNMLAYAQKPAGITAAKALDSLSDNQSKRFMLVADRYEQFFLDLADMTIDQSRDLYEENKDLSIKTIQTQDGFLKEIKWSEVDMDSDRFRVRAFPTNAFSDTPAARIQEVSTAVQAGWLSQPRAEQLLEIIPDFKEQVNLDTASLQRVRKQLDDIIHESVYTPPDIYLQLDEAKVIATATLNRSMNQGVEESKLQEIRNYIDDIQELQGLGQPPPAPPPPNPLAQPEALPTSDMMPLNAPPAPPPPS